MRRVFIIKASHLISSHLSILISISVFLPDIQFRGIEMESEQRNDASRKRLKPNMEEKEEDQMSNGTVVEITEKEQSETNIVGSEEMELNISHIFEKIERFTELVSELLESGKTMFKELSNEFEERLILIHKEQMEKWQEELKELRMLDASNEEADAVLSNARFLLQNPLLDS